MKKLTPLKQTNVQGRGDMLIIKARDDLRLGDFVIVNRKVMEVRSIEFSGTSGHMLLTVVPGPKFHEFLGWLITLPGFIVKLLINAFTGKPWIR